jgi:hypothetical protein
MNYEIRRFDLLSVFKVCFLIYLIVGLVIGLFYSLILMKIMGALSPMIEDEMMRDLGKVGGAGIFMLAVFMAVVVAVVWSILTVIAAALYNVLAGSLGGIRMELASPELTALQRGAPPVPPPPTTLPPTNTGSTL